MPTKEKKQKTQKSKKPLAIRILRKVGKVCLILFIFSIVWVIAYRFINPPVTPLMVTRVFQQAFSSERKVQLKKDWVDLEEISPYLIQAAITSEDGRFLEHNGFDFKEIEKAYKDYKSGKRKRGASTISMQTARNVFLFPTNGPIRKGLEAYFTCLIEFFWGKSRILEVYLNVIEFGDGVYGCEEAAEVNFNRPARKLSQKQAALMVACLPSPLKRSAKSPSRYVNKRANDIMQIMGYVNVSDFVVYNKKNGKK